MGTTPTFLIPYPEPTDSVDVPRDIKAAAQRVDAVLLSQRQVWGGAATAQVLIDVNVWGEIASANVQTEAGGVYLVVTSGSAQGGGANGVAGHRILFGAAAGYVVTWTAVVGVAIPISYATVVIATTTGTIKVAWQASINVPSTGLVIQTGSYINVARLG
jgi:hypothetical protein